MASRLLCPHLIPAVQAVCSWQLLRTNAAAVCMFAAEGDVRWVMPVE
jgi:hypothetical protein